MFLKKARFLVIVLKMYSTSSDAESMSKVSTLVLHHVVVVVATPQITNWIKQIMILQVHSNEGNIRFYHVRISIRCAMERSLQIEESQCYHLKTDNSFQNSIFPTNP